MLMSACSRGAPKIEESVSSSSPKIESSDWSSEGSAYTQTAMGILGNYRSVFAHGSDFYASTVFFDIDGEAHKILKNGTETIYSLKSGYIECAFGNNEGIWIVEVDTSTETKTEQLRLVSYDGEVLSTVNISEFAQLDSPIYTMRCTADTVFLKAQEAVLAVDSSLKTAVKISTPSTSSSLVIGDDGNAYLAYYTDSGIEINLIDGNSLRPIATVAETAGKLYGGNEEHCFLIANNKGLFGLNTDGTQAAIIIWSDCGIAITNIVGVVAMPNNDYLLLDMMGASRLSLTDPSKMIKKVTLTVATVGNANEMKPRIMDYNRNNSRFYVELKDYSDGGLYDSRTALNRLNTEIISGKYPDLISFSDMSPFAYIKKGYLFDMCELMDVDPDVTQDDIVILQQLKVNGGVYFMTGDFAIESRVGLFSDFGDVSGWTLEKYLEVEKNAPTNMEIMYNMTKPFFLRGISARYAEKAIDWETGSCDFDNEEFVAILEAAKRIKETPEPTTMAQLNTTPGYARLLEETLFTDAFWVSNVWSIASYEKRLGQEISVIGWPTPDGSCGSDIYLNAPVGICSQTENVEGCWDFIKYILTGTDASAFGMLPVYRHYLQNSIDNALREEPEGGVQINQKDADRFMELLSTIETVGLYDQTALDIIEEEAAAFFAGDKTAEETAKIIQQRVSLYVAEQS